VLGETVLVVSANMLKRLAATRIGVWVIKRMIAPLDRRPSPMAHTLLLTTTKCSQSYHRDLPLLHHSEQGLGRT
jgi:hypothetical protein